jgi:hypothetical protein
MLRKMAMQGVLWIQNDNNKCNTLEGLKTFVGNICVFG